MYKKGTINDVESAFLKTTIVSEQQTVQLMMWNVRFVKQLLVNNKRCNW